MVFFRIAAIGLLFMSDRLLSAGSERAMAPVAKRVPKELVNHGDRRVDDYFWLRQKTNSEVIRYLEAENGYTDAVMAPTRAFQEKLYQEILGHLKETDSSAPLHRGDCFYYSRT